jgi:molecular chaperone DnaJ
MMEQSTLNTRDYYELLGVAREADEQTIKSAFHRLARRYHPDQSKEPDAEERFKEIAGAYAVLSDPAKRADYDSRGLASRSEWTTEDPLQDLDFADLLATGLDLGTLFGRPMNGAGSGDETPSTGADVRIQLEIPLTAVASGTEAPVRFTSRKTCGTCGGDGAKPGVPPESCRGCGGTGQRTVTRTGGHVFLQRTAPCPLCSGTGRIVRQFCSACNGRGQEQVEENLTVKIPPGVEEGTVLRVRGRGQPSAIPGRRAGDLQIVVHSAPHPDFMRQGADLWHRRAIPVADAVLGTNLTVSGLENNIPVKIPAGTQPGTVLHLDGQGLPNFRRRGRGDLYLTIDVEVPSSLSAHEQQLYEQLREPPPDVRRRPWRRRSRSASK